MAEDRAKWDEMYQIYHGLNKPLQVRAGDIYSRINQNYSLAKSADDLEQAIAMATDELNEQAAKANRDDMVKDYEDALAGADIIRNINIKGE